MTEIPRRPGHPERILVLRPGALGDLILTIPVLHALSHRDPRPQVELSAPSCARDILDGRGLIHQFHPVDLPGLHTLFGPRGQPDTRIREFLESFDGVLSYWADEDGTLRRGLAKCVRGWLVTCPPKPPPDAAIHASEHLLGPVAAGRDAQESHPGPMLRATEEEHRAARSLIRGAGIDPASPFLIVHPGSGSPKKNWPAERFARLVQRITESAAPTPILLEGPADESAARTVRAAIPAPGMPWIHHPPLNSLIGVLAAATAYVGNDSGVSHLAGALDVPGVFLFGPTAPAQWKPLGSRTHVIWEGHDLSRISVDQVFAAVQEAVRRRSESSGLGG